MMHVIKSTDADDLAHEFAKQLWEEHEAGVLAGVAASDQDEELPREVVLRIGFMTGARTVAMALLEDRLTIEPTSPRRPRHWHKFWLKVKRWLGWKGRVAV